MRKYDQGAMYRVTVSEREVDAFNRRWPCSTLSGPYSFTYDKRSGDLVDMTGQGDGPEHVALSQDAQAYGASERTRTVFRVDDEGTVFALFPDDLATPEGLVTCYQHVGQHSSADYNGCMATSRPATPEKYADLKRELLSLGYVVQVVKRRGRLPKVSAAQVSAVAGR